MEREKSARPMSTRPPSAVPVPRTASMMSAASRPITQQGLSGLRPIHTSGEGPNRIYHDKRYYVSMVQTQINKIQDEIARLRKESDEIKMKTLNVDGLKKTAQDLAKKIEEQQETLNVYNTALEMHISKTKEEELVAETERIKKENEAKYKELDSMFTEKVRLQEKTEKVKSQLDEEDRAIKTMIEQLSEEDRERYFAMVQENEKVVEDIEIKQSELKGYKDKIDYYKSAIGQSKEKQEMFQLLQTQQRLEDQKEELVTFLQNSLTPAQQREALLQQVKQDKADMEALSKLKASLELELSAKKDRLGELDRELDGKDNARLKKHRELRERGEHMDAFISSYDEKAAVVNAKIETVRNQILFALEHIAGNIAELDLEEFGTTIQVDSSDQSLEAWNKRCSLLSSQKERLKFYIEKYEKEKDKLRRKQVDLLREIDDLSDLDRKKAELKIEKSNLVEEEVLMKAKLESTQAAVVEVQRRKADIMKKLNDNPSYHEVVSLEKEIENFENKTKDAEDTLKAELSNDVIEELNRSVDELLATRNAQLIDKLKLKKK